MITALPGAEVMIGRETGLSGVVVYSKTSIKIGRRVKLGANCLIMDHDDHPEDARSGIPKPIQIEDDVWLGANVHVMKGVKIGCGALVGANSVVTKDLPPHCVAVGAPAKVVRMLSGPEGF